MDDENFFTIFAALLIMPLFALEQDEAIKGCRQSKSVPDFRIFYDKNATSEQIDAELDQILDFWR